MIDFHSHILPGLDDGALGIDESILMAKAMSAFGFETVCCTPHCIKGYYVLPPEKVKEATLVLQADLDNAGIQLDLWSGMEYFLDEYLPDYSDNLLPLGPTRLVLCEAPRHADHECVQAGLQLIIAKGYVPLIAHPERTPYFYDLLTSPREGRGTRDGRAPEDKRRFFQKVWPFASRDPRSSVQEAAVPRPSVFEGCLFLSNHGSFTGYYGPQVQARAYELLKLGAYAGIASDLHDAESASQVLQRDKLDFNPLLRKISTWDGQAPFTLDTEHDEPKGQGELF